MLSRWRAAIRIILFPIDTLYWRLSNTRGYQWYKDTWMIEGCEYTGALMRGFADMAVGKEIRIVRRVDGVVTFEELNESKFERKIKLEFEKLEIKPGDTIVVKVRNWNITEDEANKIKSSIEKLASFAGSILIVNESMDISVTGPKT